MVLEKGFNSQTNNSLVLINYYLKYNINSNTKRKRFILLIKIIVIILILH